MREKRTVMLGVATVSLLGLVSLGISPEQSLGCGGTEFEGDSQFCSVAEFEMTMDSVDWEPVERKMCLRTLKTEGGCAVYEYSLVGVDQEPPARDEVAAEHLQIIHGRACQTPRIAGTLVETIDEKPVEIAMVGTPTRAPIPLDDTVEPLATGRCLSTEWDEGEFELSVKSGDEGP